MFGALSTHYKREEERRLMQLQQQQQRRLQQQRAAVAAQAAAANAKKLQSLQPTNGQYLSTRSRTPDPPRKGGAELPPPYRSQSSGMPPSQLRNGDVGRVQLVEQQLKPSRSDVSSSSSSSSSESDDEPPPPPPTKTTTKVRRNTNEWKNVSTKAKTVGEMNRTRKAVL